jgi:hypothetical protein
MLGMLTKLRSGVVLSRSSRLATESYHIKLYEIPLLMGYDNRIKEYPYPPYKMSHPRFKGVEILPDSLIISNTSRSIGRKFPSTFCSGSGTRQSAGR